MNELNAAVERLTVLVGEEQAALLIGGLARSLETGEKAVDGVINWFGGVPKLTSATRDAMVKLSRKPFAEVESSRQTRLEAFRQLYEFATDKEQVLIMAKQSLSSASYQRFRERVGLAKSRKG